MIRVPANTSSLLVFYHRSRKKWERLKSGELVKLDHVRDPAVLRKTNISLPSSLSDSSRPSFRRDAQNAYRKMDYWLNFKKIQPFTRPRQELDQSKK